MGTSPLSEEIPMRVELGKQESKQASHKSCLPRTKEMVCHLPSVSIPLYKISYLKDIVTLLFKNNSL